MLPKHKPTQLFQETAMDFWYLAGRQYLIWVDCYSDWPIIASVGKDTTTNCLLAALRETFSQTACLITAKKITKTVDSKHKDGAVLLNILKETAPSLYYCFITNKNETFFMFRLHVDGASMYHLCCLFLLCMDWQRPPIYGRTVWIICKAEGLRTLHIYPILPPELWKAEAMIKSIKDHILSMEWQISRRIHSLLGYYAVPQ